MATDRPGRAGSRRAPSCPILTIWGSVLHLFRMRRTHLPVVVILVVLGLLVAAPAIVVAGEFQAKVVRVIDGDTFELRHDGQTERARFRGIDCPELKQPYGKQAKRAVSAMVTGLTVGVRTHGKDKQGILVADLYLEGGRSVSRMLLQEGLAWRLKSLSDEELEAAEADAQYAKRGLWSDPHPVAPWVYRASKPRKRPSVTLK